MERARLGNDGCLTVWRDGAGFIKQYCPNSSFKTECSWRCPFFVGETIDCSDRMDTKYVIKICGGIVFKDDNQG